MPENPRPLPVWVVACLYLLVGCVAFVSHFHDLGKPDGGWVILTESLAIVTGVFLLLRQNWARWLAVAWMAFHVAISYGDIGKLIVHSCFLVLIVWLLFRESSRRYFRGAKAAG
ncbi:MAG: hypothetical protein M1568_04850 [Acidobacteria bacterium]|nr:hypothetical protein [Acidobacteriota bacterium]